MSIASSTGNQTVHRGNISNISESLKVLQLNAQHAKQAQLGLNNWIDKQKQGKYIIMVQEPYVYNHKAAMQPQTANKYIGGNGKTPRTCIYTHPKIQAWYLDQLSDRDATAI